MTTNELRNQFLKFFESKGHRIVGSDTLVPTNDPSVLFTSAGMNQFKQQFLGKVGDFRRATSSQKCLRTGDLENVGRTASHHTFFEMLGNFSFGDYFKKEAIMWAWEFLTQTLSIDPEKLWVSVYEEDQEAYGVWLNDINVPKEKIFKFGQKDNFWPANATSDGPNGPCGPCSEIFFDWGSGVGCGKSDCSPACSCGRFIEIWNLVFTQFNRKDGGQLDPLPSKNIDTGMGLERMAACMQGVHTNFEIDIIRPLVEEVRKRLGVDSDQHTEKVNSIVDHARAITFSLCDGVLPSNEGRGYVIRKLIRRASWFGQELGYKKPFLYQLVSLVASVMSEPYPELLERRENLAAMILAEEERFINNLAEGSSLLKETIADLKQRNVTQIDGQTIFKLYDTFGFPVELTELLAEQNNLALDLAGFNKEMARQREAAREKSAMATNIFARDIIEFLPSHFIGYEKNASDAQVIQLVQAKRDYESLSSGSEGWLILDKTPFYAEAGGQVADTGKIVSNDNKTILHVTDVKKFDESIVHVVSIEKGSISVGDSVRAEIDTERREAIRRAHTATHLLQAALRKVLGQHVRQAGSCVEPDRFRFDFTHFKNINNNEIEAVNRILQERIRANEPVTVQVLSKEEALQSGALALFGEKYGDTVRVISIADLSKEFCGGTHLDATGTIGTILIESESSIGSGVRRIEAVTGIRAEQITQERLKQLEEIARMLKTDKDNVVASVQSLVSKQKKAEKDLVVAAKKAIHSQIPQLMQRSLIACGKYQCFISKVDNLDAQLLRTVSDFILDRSKHNTIIFLTSDRGIGLVRVSNDITNTINAATLFSKIVKPFGGSGGGRPDFAQGGMKDASRIEAVVTSAQEILTKELKS